MIWLLLLLPLPQRQQENNFMNLHQQHIKPKSRKIIFAIIFTALTVSLTSCYTTRQTTLMQDTKSLPDYSNTNFESYKIQPNDELIYTLNTNDEVLGNIFNNNNSVNQQTNNFPVYPDSTVELPFLPPIKVAGLTLTEANKVIKKQYQELMPDAEVKISIANKTYTVIGDAGNGIFSLYKDKLTIYEALAQAGEISLSGDRKHVRIIRDSDSGKPEILEFDIRPQSLIDSKYYYIYPNDIIYIQRDFSSFYRINNYSSFIGLISSSISLLITVIYFTKNH